MLTRRLIVIATFLLLACASAGQTSRDTTGDLGVPNLRALIDSCRAPSPTSSLSLAPGPSVGVVAVAVRSTGHPKLRRDVSLALLGPMEGKSRYWRSSGHLGVLRLDGIPAGRYAIGVAGIGHYPRVDTVFIGPHGATIEASLEVTPSHWCGYGGAVGTAPGAT